MRRVAMTHLEAKEQTNVLNSSEKCLQHTGNKTAGLPAVVTLSQTIEVSYGY